MTAGADLRADEALAGVEEILGAYARAHGIDAWLWQRCNEGWTCAAGTASPRAQGPGECAANVPALNRPELRVEVGDPDEESACAKAEFLSLLLSRSFRAYDEGRFFGREIAERYEEITLLYTISEVLGSVISLEEAAHTILREVTDTMGVLRAALWVHEPEDDTLRLVASVGGETPPGPIAVSDDSSITAAVFRDRRPMILEPGDIYPRHERFGAPSNRDSFLAVPVSYTPPNGESRTIGVINLVGRRVEEGFSAGDHKLITAIASQVGAAIENSRLVSESLRQERVLHELELAHDLQLKLLPPVDRLRDRAEVAARCSPAESVGGDFYHLFRLPNGRVGVTIGDVSSHGFAAALIMALTMSAVAIHASEGDPPAEVLRRVHRTLVAELETTEMYMTLFYGVIDPRRKKLFYANAGHSHSFAISRAGDARRLAVTSPPLGVIDPDQYEETSVPWAPGEDLLFLFTDGLADCLGGGVGEAALVDHVVRQIDRPLEQILESLFEIEAQPTEIPSDDRTAVLVRV